MFFIYIYSIYIILLQKIIIRIFTNTTIFCTIIQLSTNNKIFYLITIRISK